MSAIRVTYSGLISLAVGLGSVGSGLIFTLIITRSLEQEELGAWSLLGTLLAYVLVINPVISYWSTREIARGEESGKTAISSSGFFSVVSMLAFVALVLVFSREIDFDFSLLFLAVILVPVNFFMGTLIGISRGYKPQVEEYGILGFEFSKVPIALVAIYFLDMGLEGLIATVFLANIMGIVIMALKIRGKLKGSFDRNYVKKWLKFFWIPSFPKLTDTLETTDVVIFSLFTGSVAGLAFWAVSNAISNVVMHAGKIGKPTYPKLLSGGKKEYFHESLALLLYFAIPIFAMSVVFARPALFALNPIYEAAYYVVYALVPLAFMRMLSDFFAITLTGAEKVDTDERASFADYMRSKLFYLPALKNLQKGVYLALLLSVFWIVVTMDDPTDLDLVWYWAVTALVSQIPLTIYTGILARKEFGLGVGLWLVFKYVAAAVSSFAAVWLLMADHLEYKEGIFDFLPDMAAYLVLGGALYVGITYVIDHRTRRLARRIVSHLVGRGGKS